MDRTGSDTDIGASSFEQSVFRIRRGNEFMSPPDDDEMAKRLARGAFSKYPEFLARPWLTLGLLQAVQTSKNCSLRTSLPFDVLAFKRPWR